MNDDYDDGGGGGGGGDDDNYIYSIHLLIQSDEYAARLHIMVIIISII